MYKRIFDWNNMKNSTLIRVIHSKMQHIMLFQYNLGQKK